MEPADDATARVDGVRVAVRVRPLNARERARAADSALEWRVGATEVAQAAAGRAVPANTFAFDHVFGEAATNADVFDSLARPVVGAALDGYNATIFAYGQTSSGKTHSMLGSADDPGVTRRAIQEVFEAVRRTPDRQFLLRASYIEIYQEIIRDLLEPSHDNLKIHEDLNRRVYVEAREEVVSSVEEVMKMISDGESVRAVGETNMNDRSSRSHTIFRLLIESRAAHPSDTGLDGAGKDDREEPVDDGIAVRASTLSLVDLAGSERANLTGAEGVRLKEGSHINKSLLTLGNVINKLSSSEPGATAHIPYRDSKLTRILQPALGGNARTAILCAITPAVMHMEETLSTLKFASRAKKVKNRTQCNEYLNDTAKLRRCEREVAQLKKMLSEVTTGDGSGTAKFAEMSSEAAEVSTKRRIQAFQENFETLLRYMKKDSSASETVTTGLHPPRRRRPSSHSFRCALDLCVAAKRRRLSCGSSKVFELTSAGYDVDETSDDLSPDVEDQLAGLRKSVFSAEQARARMKAEIDYERKAMAAELDTLAQVAEEANRSRYAAEDECQEAASALAHAQSAAIVSEMISTAMVQSVSKKEICKAEERITQLQRVEEKAKELGKKNVVLERDLADAKKREKRGVGPVLREVELLKGKLSDADSKLRAAKQTGSKNLSEKAAVEKQLLGKERQMRILESELQKYRKHENMSNNRADKQIAAEKQKAEAVQREMQTATDKLTSELDASVKQQETMSREVEKLTEQIEASSATVKELQAELDEKTALVDAANKQTADVEKLRAALQDNLEETTANQKVSALAAKEELTKAETLIQEKDEQLRKAKAEADELGSELANLHMSGEEIRAELQSNQSQLKVLKKELEEATEALSAREAAAAVAKEEASSLKVTLSTLETEKKTLQDTVSSLTDDVNSGRQEREQSAITLSNMTEQSAEALATAHGEIERLQTLLDRARAESTEIRTQAASMSDSLAQEAQKQRDSSVEMERLRVALEASQMQCAEVRAEMSSMSENLASEKRKQDDSSRELDRLRAALGNSGNTAAKAESRIAALSQQMEEKSRMSADEISRLTSQLAEMRRVHRHAGDELKAQKEEVRIAREFLEAQNDRLAAEVEKSSKKGVVLLEKVYERDGRIGELEEKLAEYRRSGGAIRKLEQKLERRDATIEELRRVLDEQTALITRGGLGEEWSVVERASQAEATLSSLRAQVTRQEAEIARLEARETAGQEERRMLRREIKVREVAREKARSDRVCNALRAKENDSQNAS